MIKQKKNQWPQDRSLEIIQLKEQKKKEWVNKAWDLWDTSKQISICIMGVSEGEEREKKEKFYLKK